MDLRLGFLARARLGLLRRDLEVAGLAAVGQDGLGLAVGQGTVDLVPGHVFSVFCRPNRGERKHREKISDIVILLQTLIQSSLE